MLYIICEIFKKKNYFSNFKIINNLIIPQNIQICRRCPLMNNINIIKLYFAFFYRIIR